MIPEVIADRRCELGEGPLWHSDERRLYWVDIADARLWRWDPSSGAADECLAGHTIGGFTIQADGALLLFMARGAVATWRDGRLEYVIQELADERETRFNDVIADPAGRVFCGTMPTRQRKGRLYRLDPDGTASVMLEGIGTSNGMGFTPDCRCMYYTDSRACAIYLFDYDEGSGALSRQRTFVEVPEGEGVPDGLTVDAEGCIWSARWDGGCLVRYAPDGREVERIAFPARKVTCPTFGGADYGDLFVTTAGGNRCDEEGQGAGAVFRLRPGVRGVPEFRSFVGL